MVPIQIYHFSMITEAKIKQHPERATSGEEGKILAEGMIAHIGFHVEGRTHVIPMSYHYDPSRPDCIYIHGSRTSRLMKAICSGIPLCVEVTMLDGLVYSRSAKYHSMNYRSVVCFGNGGEVMDPQEKGEIFRHAIDRYFPGREEGRDYKSATAEHLAATSLAEIRITEWSAKAREGSPKGPLDADPNAEGTCGVISTMVG
jgi:nitroimidazol reductase NimA-like FMN-containing flavoprotein (pyridoxamine 5'-phosphate oxidase superfamily)